MGDGSMNNKQQRNSNPTLHETPLFRWSIRIPVYASIVLFGLVCTDNQVPMSFQSEDIATAFQIFKLPLLTLGLIVPLTALSAAMHRSEQTARQINTQNEQNNFSNHFKHLEEFKKAFFEQKPQPTHWGGVESLHRCIYPNTLSGDLAPLSSSECNRETVQSFLNEDPYPHFKLVERTDQITRSIMKHYGVSSNRLNKITKKYTPSDLKRIISVIDRAYSFGGMNEPPFWSNTDDWMKPYIEIFFVFSRVNDNKRHIFEGIIGRWPNGNLNRLLHDFQIEEDQCDIATKYFFETLSQSELTTLSELNHVEPWHEIETLLSQLAR